MRNNAIVPAYRISEAAELLGVSDDTVRRWIDTGRLPTVDGGGPTRVPGAELAAFALALADQPDGDRRTQSSARNQLRGLVTRVVKDTVMAQVELVCGPYRVVSLMSAEAATELGLEPGVTAIASIKSTSVVIEKP